MIETMLFAVILLLATVMLMVGYILIQIGQKTSLETYKSQKKKRIRLQVKMSKEERDLIKKVNEYNGGR